MEKDFDSERSHQTIKSGVVLIGPERSGKTTVGRLLASSLGLSFHDLSGETKRFREGREVDQQTLAHIYQTKGYGAVIRHRMPQRANTVELALAAYGPL